MLLLRFMQRLKWWSLRKMCHMQKRQNCNVADITHTSSGAHSSWYKRKLRVIVQFNRRSEPEPNGSKRCYHKMLLKSCLLLLLCGVVALSATNYDGYKIYDVNARNNFEKQLMLRLSQNEEYDFFDLPREADAATRIMVQPKDQSSFEDMLSHFNLDYTIVDENFGATLEKEQLENQSQRLMTARSTSRSVGFTAFHRFAEINAYLDELAKAYPSRVSVQTVGKSYEGRYLKTITITNGDGKTGKNVVFLDAGIHAREWIAHAGALYVIHQLAENFAANADLLKNYDWVILPVVNPDGYEYTHSTTRLWRKTRKPAGTCSGTDANRNFDFHWGEVGASSSSCADTFKGVTAFSEPETQIVRDLLLGLTGRGKFYLTLHSYGNYLLYPWGWTSALPSDWKIIDEVAQAGADAIRSSTGTRYSVGSSTNVLYAAAGGSDDYAFGVAGFPISITMELPAGGTGFNPTTAQILPFVTETWTGIRAMALKVIDKY
ncbi:carboxypeptidase B isoform X1 [Drosophila albomicans]|uniref:Carboxypeptidase B isoform X1 n=1 Tax=Drosophila albomicans TaxID=7291 RepID=A0A6P8X043_DROAB|nr:carboxypeptidase B isoform X1 [Drosophila albomicans]